MSPTIEMAQTHAADLRRSADVHNARRAAIRLLALASR